MTDKEFQAQIAEHTRKLEAAQEAILNSYNIKIVELKIKNMELKL